MTLHAWNNYKLYAWGKNELRPVSRGSNGGPFGNADIGATIIDSLDTLYIMGLDEEYQKGRDWVEKKFSFRNLVSRMEQKNQIQLFFFFIFHVILILYLIRMPICLFSRQISGLLVVCCQCMHSQVKNYTKQRPKT